MRYGQSLNENIAMCDYVLDHLMGEAGTDDDMEYLGLVCEWLEAMRDGWRSELHDIRAHRWTRSPFDAQG
jgi:hypothetical protein